MVLLPLGMRRRSNKSVSFIIEVRNSLLAFLLLMKISRENDFVAIADPPSKVCV